MSTSSFVDSYASIEEDLETAQLSHIETLSNRNVKEDESVESQRFLHHLRNENLKLIGEVEEKRMKITEISRNYRQLEKMFETAEENISDVMQQVCVFAEIKEQSKRLGEKNEELARQLNASQAHVTLSQLEVKQLTSQNLENLQTLSRQRLELQNEVNASQVHQQASVVEEERKREMVEVAHALKLDSLTLSFHRSHDIESTRLHARIRELEAQQEQFHAATATLSQLREELETRQCAGCFLQLDKEVEGVGVIPSSATIHSSSDSSPTGRIRSPVDQMIQTMAVQRRDEQTQVQLENSKVVALEKQLKLLQHSLVTLQHHHEDVVRDKTKLLDDVKKFQWQDVESVDKVLLISPSHRMRISCSR